MGFYTIDLAIFVPPNRLTQAQNWLRNNYNIETDPVPLVQVDDPPEQEARYYGIELRATPEMLDTIQELAALPQFSTAKLRYRQRGQGPLRKAVKQEMAERGWKIKRG